MTGTTHEDLLRELAPQVLGALVRRYGHFDSAEDAVQEALIAAAGAWARDGTPADPRAWLITVAARRLVDILRSDQARRRREQEDARRALPEQALAPAADHATGAADDTLVLLFLCCHPALSEASQIALTLRAVGGLSTAEIARVFLVPEATMTRRITRAKRSVAESNVPFALPAGADRSARLAAVLHVLYLIFTEGYASTSGPEPHRRDLSDEAIRLTRMLRRLTGQDAPEVAGLLALMLLTDARRAARTGPDGALVPMAEQDRSLWDRTAIGEGVTLLSDVLPLGRSGPYQVQAAIAAIHDEAPTAAQTDWPQIAACYLLLRRMQPDNPVVALNHAVALGMAEGPQAGLEMLATVASDRRVSDDRRLQATRAHLLEMAGDLAGARDAYAAALSRAANEPQQRYLRARLARLAEGHRAEHDGA